MFADTRPAPLDESGLAEFRLDSQREQLAYLRQLRDGSVPVLLAAPDGASINTSLWAIDDTGGRLNFSVEAADPQLERLVDSNEAVAVAYLDSVKLQFDLQGLLLVRSTRACALQSRMPRVMYRFQRRNAYRVRTMDQHSPVARLRHPALPEMALTLRVLDVSAGGCALLLPPDVPSVQPGIRIAGVGIELDADTRFTTTLQLQHVTSIGSSDRGVRLGCEWSPLAGNAERALQRYIDQTQKRRRLLQARATGPG